MAKAPQAFVGGSPMCRACVNAQKKADRERETERNRQARERARRGEDAPEWAVGERERDLERKQAKRAAGKDVELPGVAEPERRAACEHDGVLFGETYFPHLYYLPPADYQVARRRAACEVVRWGGQEAAADPRGSGKSTDLRVTTLWGIAYGHVRSMLVCCANLRPLGEKFMRFLKTELETNDLFAEDFPEMCLPFRALEGSAQRCRTQTIDGKLSRIQYSGDTIQFPDVEGLACRGALIEVRGLEGAMRGGRFDMIIIDDPETSASVRSEPDTKRIEEVITHDLPGMAAPGRTLAMFWRGTIMRRGCLVDRYTDRDLTPSWMGRRNKAVLRWPDNMGLWETYWELRVKGFQGDPTAEDERWREPDATARRAHEFYLANREAMDDGFDVSWADDYVRDETPDGSPLEISAQEHYMNMVQRIGEEAFATEYQNEPVESPDGVDAVGVAQIQSRKSDYDHKIVPEWAEHVVRFVDVGGREIHTTTYACAGNYTGVVVDYDIVHVHAPPGDLRDPNSEARKAVESRVLEKLREIRDVERAEGLLTPDGEVRQVELTGVDAGWLGHVVQQFVAESGPTFRACVGRGTRQGQKRFTAPKTTKDVKAVRPHWFASRQGNGRWLFVLNADHWKLFCHERFLQDLGTSGAASLFHGETQRHRRYSTHIVAERWDPEAGRWIKMSAYNHWLDCTAGCFALADMVGCRLEGELRPKRRPRSKVAARTVAGPIRTKY